MIILINFCNVPFLNDANNVEKYTVKHMLKCLFSIDRLIRSTTYREIWIFGNYSPLYIIVAKTDDDQLERSLATLFKYVRKHKFTKDISTFSLITANIV